ncbi:MAG: hypothetical protein V5A72_01100 [Candidatus Nanohaloarchaea archaeon]
MDSILYWFEFPEPEANEEDNVWSQFHLFDGDWVEIMNKKEYYNSPHVPSIYTEHKKIVKQNMGMEKPFESYYYQNVDNGSFASVMEIKDSVLPSGNGELKLDVEIETVGPPSGENNACEVEYFVKGSIRYDIPNGIDFLPRILARPLNRFFKWAFFKFIGEEQIEYDGEYAKERINEYFQYIRKYHGEEPLQTKSRQAVFKPSVKDGVFFQ